MVVYLGGRVELSDAGHSGYWYQNPPATYCRPRIMTVSPFDEKHPLVALQTWIFNDGKSLGDAIDSAEGYESNRFSEELCIHFIAICSSSTLIVQWLACSLKHKNTVTPASFCPA